MKEYDFNEDRFNEDRNEMNDDKLDHEKTYYDNEDIFDFHNMSDSYVDEEPYLMQELPEEVPDTENEPVPNESSQIVYYEETIKPNEKKGSSFKKIMAAVLAASIVGGSCIGLGIGLSGPISDRLFMSEEETTQRERELGREAVHDAEDTETDTFTFSDFEFPASSDASAVPVAGNLGSIEDIVEAVFPSVVSITSTVKGSANYFNMYEVPYEQSGSGSGVIFYEDSERIYIVTNNHVVTGAYVIMVSFDDEENIVANVIGADSQSDLAVISVSKSDVQAAGVTNYKVASLGNSSEMKIGATAIAIGNALGRGKTATQGIVSAVGKTINVDGNNLEVIQTDAAINPGNSGGALVNSSGEVIGINTAKLSSSTIYSSSSASVEGMGFAIPSDTLKPIVEQLMQNGYISKPYLGVTVENITDEIADLYQLPVGVLVRSVEVGSAADLAGITQGDIIVSFGGEIVMNRDQLSEALSNYAVGDTVSVRVIRNGKTAVDLKVTIQDANKQGF